MNLKDVYDNRQKRQRRNIIAGILLLLLLPCIWAVLYFFDGDEYQTFVFDENIHNIVINVNHDVSIYSSEEDNDVFYCENRYVKYGIYVQGGTLYINEADSPLCLSKLDDVALYVDLKNSIDSITINGRRFNVSDIHVGDMTVNAESDVYIWHCQIGDLFIETNEAYIDVGESNITELNAVSNEGYFGTYDSRYQTINVQINKGDINISDLDSEYCNLSTNEGDIVVSTKESSEHYDAYITAMSYYLENDVPGGGIVDNVNTLNITAMSGYVFLTYAVSENEGGTINE